MGDYVETLEYAKIIADKIKESSRFFQPKICGFKYTLKLLKMELNVETLDEVVLHFLEKPKESYNCLVKVLGGFECSAAVNIITIIGTLARVYGFRRVDALTVLNAIKRNDAKALIKYALTFKEKVASTVISQSSQYHL